MDAPSLSGAIQSQSVGTFFSQSDNTDILPKLIATFNYSDFTVSATKWKTAQAMFNRNAKKRTFIFQSTLNQPTSSTCTLQPYESTVNFQGIIASPSGSSGNALTVNGQAVVSSDYSVTLGTAVDSFNIGVPMGATLPTSGQVLVYVVEAVD
jgi:hypothetical protein